MEDVSHTVQVIMTAMLERLAKGDDVSPKTIVLMLNVLMATIVSMETASPIAKLMINALQIKPAYTEDANVVTLISVLLSIVLLDTTVSKEDVCHCHIVQGIMTALLARFVGEVSVYMPQTCVLLLFVLLTTTASRDNAIHFV